MADQPVLRAYVSLGSNCESAAAMLEEARAALAALPHMLLGAVSPVYRTEPQEYADQPWFLNQVVELFPGEVWQPCSLVDALLELEAQVEQTPAEDTFRELMKPQIEDVDGLFGATLINADKDPNGFAFDKRMEPVFNGAKDTAGRPLFLDATYTEAAGPVRLGSLLGYQTAIGRGVYAATPKIFGYLGDWTQVAWGAVGNISYKVSTEASVTINGSLVSLFENNLVAILAEAEYGFLVNDPASFVKFTNAA